MRGVIAHRAADVNRRGEHVEISLFERADVVGADFGGVGDLGDREFSGFARGAELFGDRWHSPYLAGLTRDWQSCKTHHMKTLLRRLLLVFLGLAVLIALFYAEEDWRGKRAWENCKRELEAKGAVLDWDKFIPPPVPDDQNFFKASKKIAFSFVHSRNYGEADLYAKQPRIQLGRTESNSFPILDTAKTRSIAVALLTVIPPGSATFKSTGNRLVLQFNDPAARSKAGQLIQNTIGRSANGSQGFKFSEFQLTNLNPDANYSAGRSAAIRGRTGKSHVGGHRHQHRPFAGRSHR